MPPPLGIVSASCVWKGPRTEPSVDAGRLGMVDCVNEEGEPEDVGEEDEFVAYVR